MDKGKLYGVGTGPGDPELITLKAIKIIEKCNYIAVPNKIKENALSYQIALSAIPSIKHTHTAYTHTNTYTQGTANFL